MSFSRESTFVWSNILPDPLTWNHYNLLPIANEDDVAKKRTQVIEK